MAARVREQNRWDAVINGVNYRLARKEGAYRKVSGRSLLEVQQMLNKGESINSVGRILHFGKNGRINESTIEDQLEKASSLNILL